MESQDNVQRVVAQLRIDINHIAEESRYLKKSDRLAKLRKMNELRQIVSSLEDIDNSLNDLLREQSQKHPLH